MQFNALVFAGLESSNPVYDGNVKRKCRDLRPDVHSTQNVHPLILCTYFSPEFNFKISRKAFSIFLSLNSVLKCSFIFVASKNRITHYFLQVYSYKITNVRDVLYLVSLVSYLIIFNRLLLLIVNYCAL